VRLLAAYQTRGLVALHGDCVGADAHFDVICKHNRIPVTVRPANMPAMRANCNSEALAPPKPPLDRNRDIVADSDVMIACPESESEVTRSGTWSTVRAMRKTGRLLYIVLPDGEVRMENEPVA